MRLCAIFASLFLTGCTLLVPATALRFATLSPLDADPAAPGLALVLSADIDVPDGGVTIAIGAVLAGGDQPLRVGLVLETRDGDVAIAQRPGDNVTLSVLSRAEVAGLRGLQRQVADWTAADPGGTSGSISAGNAACTTGTGPDPDATASAWLKTEATGPYLPLIREAGLRSLIGADLFDAMTPCTGRQSISADPSARH